MTTHHSRNTLSLAAEYAVASELCRRRIYAQLTFGNQKRTDILVFSEDGEFVRIEVKAKQGPTWPNCKGIYGSRVLIVFVDYKDRDLYKRPDFFVLSVKDWREVLERRVDDIKAKKPEQRITISKENVSIFEDQIGRNGKPYKGMDIRPSDLSDHKDAWYKIEHTLIAG